ncbi:MAG TPA: tRNA lysidine(34) synthetase [Solirubrobacteraceae bacterium]|jgi:tRNA(Ile)-lysidine synthase|nr:tRNA lysidine(34) synthetase [Solirubrobacteraceae bacterium]
MTDPVSLSVEEVRGWVAAGGLLPHDGRLVAMLSGGRDSVCLLDLAVALCPAGAVRALHVNYGLRPAADADERHCRALCVALGVELEVVRARPPAPGNLQAWARELRYREAERLAQALEDGGRGCTHGGDDPRHRGDVARAQRAREQPRAGGRERPPGTLIAAGHTASDQVETILYRLAASPGRRALLGMAPREGRLVRPLLELTREQTAAYCRARGLSWREDESNDDERYARARVRKGVVPALRAVHPAAEVNVLRTAERLRAEAALLDELIDSELARAAAQTGTGTIAVERLRTLPGALQRLIVVRLAEDVAGTFVPQAGARVAEILALAERGGRAELHVGGLVAAVVERGCLRMVTLPPRR